MKIINKQNAQKYQWGKNSQAYLLHESTSLSVKLETMPAHESEVLHYHIHAQQTFFVLKNSATFQIEDEQFELKENDSITVLPGQKHCIKNNTEAMLEFLVISNPPTTNDRTNAATI